MAAEEMTAELAPGSVELRLRGRDPEFVVKPRRSNGPSRRSPRARKAERRPASLRTPPRVRRPVSRINLRLPDHLKARIERSRRRRTVGERLARPGVHRRTRTNRHSPATRTTSLAGPPAIYGLGALAEVAGDGSHEDSWRRERPTSHRRNSHAYLRNPRTDRRHRGARRRPRPDRRKRSARHQRRGAPERSTTKSDVTAAEQTRVEYADGRLFAGPPRGGGNGPSLGAANRSRWRSGCRRGRT